MRRHRIKANFIFDLVASKTQIKRIKRLETGARAQAHTHTYTFKRWIQVAEKASKLFLLFLLLTSFFSWEAQTGWMEANRGNAIKEYGNTRSSAAAADCLTIFTWFFPSSSSSSFFFSFPLFGGAVIKNHPIKHPPTRSPVTPVTSNIAKSFRADTGAAIFL